MDRGWYVRFTVVAALVVAALLALWPSVDQWVPAPTWVKETFSGRISPGLDIKGGLRLMYEVQVDEAITKRRDRLSENLLRMMGERIGVLEEGQGEDATDAQLTEVREKVRVFDVGDQRIRVTFESASDAEKLERDWLEEFFPDLRIVETTDEGKTVTLTIREDRISELSDTAVDQAVKTISNRIDELQIRETTVLGRDEDIIVEIPGADEEMFDYIRGIITRTASLDFKVVDDASDFVASIPDGELPEGITKDRETVSAGEGNQVVSTFLVARGEGARARLQEYVNTLEPPDGREILLGVAEEDADAEEGQETWRSYFLHRIAGVTGANVEDAFVGFDPQDQQKPIVLLRFDGEGASQFERLTGSNVKKRMAIVLDDRVESAPVINERIGGGSAQITLGSYRGYEQLLQDANELVIVLKAGALPAPIEPANEQLIGPTLGRDAVARGAEGALIGIGLVLLFMLFYYQVAGVVADIMVVLNVLFLFAVLASFEATLTLPGVAGIALTVGMAVDANVLITERIREELRLGKSPRSAVDQGFRRAFWSIFDAQLTTFIAGVVLFQYGTGPIKGFAVTLMIGIATSLFTGVFCSKVMLDWIVRGLRVDRLRVG